MVLTAAVKDEIYEEVATKVKADPRIGGWRPTGRCLFWAMYAIEAIRARGVRAILQAGSATWRIVREEDDDGVASTHFGYVWSPNEEASRKAIAEGFMPEMHVWAGIPEDQVLVDLTTGFWPEQAKLLGGFDWRAGLPPKYYWGPGEDLVEGRYTPEIGAFRAAIQFVIHNYGPDRAKALFS